MVKEYQIGKTTLKFNIDEIVNKIIKTHDNDLLVNGLSNRLVRNKLKKSFIDNIKSQINNNIVKDIFYRIKLKNIIEEIIDLIHIKIVLRDVQ